MNSAQKQGWYDTDHNGSEYCCSDESMCWRKTIYVDDVAHTKLTILQRYPILNAQLLIHIRHEAQLLTTHTIQRCTVHHQCSSMGRPLIGKLPLLGRDKISDIGLLHIKMCLMHRRSSLVIYVQGKCHLHPKMSAIMKCDENSFEITFLSYNPSSHPTHLSRPFAWVAFIYTTHSEWCAIKDSMKLISFKYDCWWI